ncbi:MAG: S9 family peptidase [Kofleriaceae bacterium]|nr:S9 family peptidase [Kofleriaceae bacterium]MCL4224786.1 prolyl oligopeptidase family serine peptidase [Myxococcales bacterium]
MRLAPLLAAAPLLLACGGPTRSRSGEPPPPPIAARPDAGATPAETPVKADDDPYLWLEDVTGERALSWVRAQNAVAQAELEAEPGFAALRDRLLSIYDSKDRIPYVVARGAWLYNFWRDDANPRGLWRRTTLAEYKKAKPRWEVVLDLDALAGAEGENWVWHGASCLYPTYERCLISLSRGGADATVVREFDAVRKAFVADGFTLPEAKTDVAWKDHDTITVGTDFGPGSLTDAGYPRIVKEWRRGTPLTEARTIFEGKATDVAVHAYREWDHGRIRDWVGRAPSFFTSESYLRDGDQLTRLDKPDDASASTWDDQLLITLRSAWEVGGRTWPAGALLVTPLADYLAGKREFTMLFEPRDSTSLDAVTGTRSALLVVELEDVKSKVYLHRRVRGTWTRTAVDTPAVGSFGVSAYDPNHSDDYWFTETGFTTPATLSLGSVGKKPRLRLKHSPSYFDARGVVATQHFATSKDGTRIPYFQIARKDLPLDGSAPTILGGYGGFEVSLTPGYDATGGAAWLERGGVLVEANIRGGGEYGPRWHQAALKRDRQRAYDDFIAVAEDLIARKVTSTPRLGIIGGSNGGLLMGVMLTQRPDLFGAIVCQVPLLDMKRYHKLLAGASWMEEYGDPDDPDDWAALARFSPYQNLRPGVTYPRTLFTTSTRDDRVHPGHARKMVARMKELGADLLYYENIEGGHGGAADNKQAAYMSALAYVFFARQLGLR